MNVDDTLEQQKNMHSFHEFKGWPTISFDIQFCEYSSADSHLLFTRPSRFDQNVRKTELEQWKTLLKGFNIVSEIIQIKAFSSDLYWMTMTLHTISTNMFYPCNRLGVYYITESFSKNLLQRERFKFFVQKCISFNPWETLSGNSMISIQRTVSRCKWLIWKELLEYVTMNMKRSRRKSRKRDCQSPTTRVGPRGSCKSSLVFAHCFVWTCALDKFRQSTSYKPQIRWLDLVF